MFADDDQQLAVKKICYNCTEAHQSNYISVLISKESKEKSKENKNVVMFYTFDSNNKPIYSNSLTADQCKVVDFCAHDEGKSLTLLVKKENKFIERVFDIKGNVKETKEVPFDLEDGEVLCVSKSTRSNVTDQFYVNLSNVLVDFYLPLEMNMLTTKQWVRINYSSYKYEQLEQLVHILPSILLGRGDDMQFTFYKECQKTFDFLENIDITNDAYIRKAVNLLFECNKVELLTSEFSECMKINKTNNFNKILDVLMKKYESLSKQIINEFKKPKNNVMNIINLDEMESKLSPIYVIIQIVLSVNMDNERVMMNKDKLEQNLYAISYFKTISNNFTVLKQPAVTETNKVILIPLLSKLFPNEDCRMLTSNPTLLLQRLFLYLFTNENIPLLQIILQYIFMIVNVLIMFLIFI